MRPTTLLDVLQEKALNIFSFFIRFCEDNNLKYYTCGGTTLGSIRHKNFIPWDDDIDVLMPRPDYVKFIELFSDKYKGEYELVTPYNTPDYYLSYSKLCLKDTTIVEYKAMGQEFGLYIDIFPLDSCADTYDLYMKDQARYEILREKLCIVSSKYNIKNICYFILRFDIRKIYNIFLSRVFKLAYRTKVLESMEKLFNQYPYGSTSHVTSYASFWIGKEYHNLSWFDDGAIGIFASLQVINPKQYHEYLTNLYGNYMTLPPVENRTTHHSYYYLNLNERVARSNIK